MEVLTAASFMALVVKVMSTVKYLTAVNVRQVITQLLTWVSAFLMLLVGANADITQHFKVLSDVPLGQLNVWSLVLGGLLLGSAGSFAYDFKKAFDGTDSAAEPALQVGPDRSE